jgi:hypothetical protein
LTAVLLLEELRLSLRLSFLIEPMKSVMGVLETGSFEAPVVILGIEKTLFIMGIVLASLDFLTIMLSAAAVLVAENCEN